MASVDSLAAKGRWHDLCLAAVVIELEAAFSKLGGGGCLHKCDFDFKNK